MSISDPCYEINSAGLDRQITIAVGRGAKATQWGNVTRTLREFGNHLSQCEYGSKDGTAFLPGSLNENGPRADASMNAIELLVYDLDTGHPIERIQFALNVIGIEAWAYATHSHMMSESTVQGGVVERWAKLPHNTRASDEQVVSYLREFKGYAEHVLAGAVVERKGLGAVVKHKPMPRYRLVIPLARPVLMTELGNTPDAAVSVYKVLYDTGARFFDIQHYDRSCGKPAQLSYMHRRPEGAGPWFWRNAGVLLGPDLLIERAKAASVVHEDKPDDLPVLRRWFARCGDGFQAARFVTDLGQDAETKEPGKVQARCPFEAQHSPGGGKLPLFAVDADPAQGRRPSISCQHNGCKAAYDTVHFVDAFLQAQEQLTAAALDGYTVTPASDVLKDNADVIEQGAVSPDDFYAYLPQHTYIFAPTGAMWPASSVNARLPEMNRLKPSVWLDYHRHVEQMTWMPGQPQLIEGRLATHDGWIERSDCATFNLYRPPVVAPGDPDKALQWRAHLQRVYPSDARHIEQWLAHRVQRPGEKINHGLVLGGYPGIGKDTLLEAARYAVGPWNFEEVGPTALLGRFNPFVKSVILRVSEARDLGDVNRYAFYERSKVYLAAPPAVITVDEKHAREYPVVNCCGVVITTNHRSGGLYLPADDRRHYVAWSEARKEDFDPRYWSGFWEWYAGGGLAHVAAYLATLSLSGFDAKAPPPPDGGILDHGRQRAIRGGDGTRGPDRGAWQPGGAHTGDAEGQGLRSCRCALYLPHRQEGAAADSSQAGRCRLHSGSMSDAAGRRSVGRAWRGFTDDLCAGEFAGRRQENGGWGTRSRYTCKLIVKSGKSPKSGKMRYVLLVVDDNANFPTLATFQTATADLQYLSLENDISNAAEGLKTPNAVEQVPVM